jgi:hypothetical protein
MDYRQGLQLQPFDANSGWISLFPYGSLAKGAAFFQFVATGRKPAGMHRLARKST